MSSNDRVRASPSTSPSPSDVERTTARYLFAIDALSTDEADRIATGDLRERLGVTPASASEMVSKLDDRGLVDHEKYRGVTLTSRGEALAARVAWRFCVVTSFFDSVLGTALDDRTALEIGVALPRDGIARLRELVTAPCLELCPESGRDVKCCAV
ncbi:metal-dependent transcriptional regulator [Halostella sp. JP-L12]|uniref:metal-dependent transcriptional regulator n=1 Tax=Halostella TaxID=1843185 RepID=UPI000EF7D8BF|nr:MULTISPECIES: metal-dependent transcriptional regulator [Halostella]NHN49166.1 metal-dependent transcriptional regulator [Halostella sp. JP-L12]